ncbi:DUF4150 domain-containing protein [Paraburkholderia panacisoli]|uniref:DUF4150 domain-containing protein n=1 Tax=Paraburkholderia panacisoli TaxID=2603818 RepID=A0A5B0HHF9_9BURK|nr:PAAR-like domain-containing protein [Paraburkholderia panacisoli]KAA1014520.1 DUF4150 domain-containing protein [Paraburkholderia panacisoli]
MSCTVFAEGMGFFHRGSGGKGVAPGDVCLSPPPPPGVPAPVPYVNMLQASDLTKGSKSVMIDGEPTALEDTSEISTSTGNEAGTQGGGVVTHKTKGVGSFKSWCRSVLVEGKGVACHGDMMIQNTACDPPNCVDAAAVTRFRKALGKKADKPCPPYDRDTHSPDITAAQEKKVKNKKCWECSRQFRAGETPLTVNPQNPSQWGGWLRSQNEYVSRRGGAYKDKDQTEMTPDHQPPLCVAWAMGGCHLRPQPPPKGFKKKMSQSSMVKPHCRRHSNSQGSQARAYAGRIVSRR